MSHGCGRYKKHDWPVEKIRHWVEVEGKTHRWVGDQIGCGNQHVSRICKKNNIKAQRTGPRSGVGHPEWKGGRNIDKDGYVLIYFPFHPNARKSRQMLEHRMVMEHHLGRYLNRREVVHHKNGNKQDNRIENLALYSGNGKHLKEELTGKCPNWSEDGAKRIQLGVERWRASRRELKLGVPPKP